MTQNRPAISFENKYTRQLRLSASSFDRTYGCHLAFTEGNKKNELKFEMNIRHLETTNSGTHIFHVNRKQETVFINNQHPDTLVDELALKIGNVLYPLLIEVNSNGTIKTISNFSEIQTRWTEARRQISNYYKGAAVEKYLASADQTFGDQTRLMQSLSYDFFLSVYFSPIYQYYSSTHQQNTDHSFPINGYSKSVRYNIAYEVEPLLNEFDAIVIQANGFLFDERSKIDLEQQLDYPCSATENESVQRTSGNFDASYFLDAKTKSILYIKSVCSLDLNVSKKVSIAIYDLETAAEKNELTTKKVPEFYKNKSML